MAPIDVSTIPARERQTLDAASVTAIVMPAHDALFKTAFTDLDSARGELRAALPAAITARIDWGTLQVEKGSFVDAALRERHTDLLFSVQLDGREARIYVLFEHQSDVDEMMPFRMLGYEVRIWEEWRRDNPGARTLPAILPVLLSQDRWTAPVELFDLFTFADAGERDALGPHLPRLEMIVDDLTVLTDESLAGRAMPETARFALAMLKHTRDAATLRGLAARLERWMTQLPDTELAREMLRTGVSYIALVRGVEVEEIVEAVAAAAPGMENKVMTTVRQLEERGEARGIALGEARGRRAAVSEMLLKLLTVRFGEVDAEARARIVAADVSTLERWVERVVTAPSLGAVLAD